MGLELIGMPKVKWNVELSVDECLMVGMDSCQAVCFYDRKRKVELIALLNNLHMDDGENSLLLCFCYYLFISQDLAIADASITCPSLIALDQRGLVSHFRG